MTEGSIVWKKSTGAPTVGGMAWDGPLTLLEAIKKYLGRLFGMPN